MCMFCSGDPRDDDHYGKAARQWETGMCNSCCNNLAGCFGALFCSPCCACYLRNFALEGDMSKYKCCQGYICGSCMKCTDGCAHACPWPCLCCEVLFCHSCAISATRIYVQHTRNIATDPCDNRIIRCSNLCQCIACLLGCVAAISGNSDLQCASTIVDLVRDIIYCTVQTCMQAQTHLELSLHPTVNSYDNTITAQPGARP